MEEETWSWGMHERMNHNLNHIQAALPISMV
jgi:hypothetical protein